MRIIIKLRENYYKPVTYTWPSTSGGLMEEATDPERSIAPPKVNGQASEKVLGGLRGGGGGRPRHWPCRQQWP